MANNTQDAEHQPNQHTGQIVPGRLLAPRQHAAALAEVEELSELDEEEIVAEHFSWAAAAPQEDLEKKRVSASERQPQGPPEPEWLEEMRIEVRGFVRRLRHEVAIFRLDVNTEREEDPGGSADDAEATLRRVETIRNGFRIDVRPMFRVARVNHWGAAPGTKPHPTDDLRARNFAPDVVSSHDARLVYVVDSGIVMDHAWAKTPTFDQASPNERVRWLKPCDVTTSKPGSASHGTFVACVVAAVSPSSLVRVVKVDLSAPPDPVLDEEDGKEDAEEVALAFAIERVAAHARARGLPAVLNMSWAAYPVYVETPLGYREVLAPMTLEKRLQLLEEWAPDVQLIAAAGNEFPHTPPGDFELPYPAVLSNVASVGASDADGSWVLFEDVPVKVASMVVTLPTVGSGAPDMVAPGVDLLAPGGPEIAQWSGSSFAAAVQSGLFARNDVLSAPTWKDYPLNA